MNYQHHLRGNLLIFGRCSVSGPDIAVQNWMIRSKSDQINAGNLGQALKKEPSDKMSSIK